jgi:hypothetical protein
VREPPGQAILRGRPERVACVSDRSAAPARCLRQIHRCIVRRSS